MARVASLLFFLSLSLCCCRSQGQRSKMSVKVRNSSPFVLGAKVELECVISDNSLADSGASWIRQPKDSAPQFILFISSLSRVAPTEDGKPPAGFEAKKDSNVYKLTVKSFQKQDQGNYYCIVNRNQMLHFSSGVPLYLPVPTTTTAAPTTKAALTPSSPASHTKAAQDCKHPSAPDTPRTKLDFSCSLFIWAPLAGACFLLLVALLVTIVVCQKSRRRRCKCKRPMNGNNGKPSMPNRYV
ncbi:T-cell surface glycoprotein CD8 alpha chain [Pelodiscus sinensis]|uniref:T-cell surface glycoprotein CD8 alpha chain n=1 Tax=Pelodiscus sinensis TaxID=13735 RepID=UPI003F6BE280